MLIPTNETNKSTEEWQGTGHECCNANVDRPAAAVVAAAGSCKPAMLYVTVHVLVRLCMPGSQLVANRFQQASERGFALVLASMMPHLKKPCACVDSMARDCAAVSAILAASAEHNKH